jgi:two-component system sensor histidine kinase BaeS
MHGNGNGNMGILMEQRLILTDSAGLVLADTSAELNGQTLSSTGLLNGFPITLNGNTVGVIIVTPFDLTSQSIGGQFIATVNQSIVTSAVIAGLIALLLGAILFLQITAPLRQLKKAAAAISHGDLSQRVKLRSRDELGELSQTFNHMAESLEQSQTQRQHMMADIAHELRTPLAVIQANLEGMQDGILPVNPDQVASLHRETLLLNRLIDDLRLLSLAEAGELKLERQSTKMDALIRQAVERLQSQAQLKGISLGVEVPENLPAVITDTDRISQVLNNLISNALRYTPEGGKIMVRAEALSAERSIQVSVTDTGSGIDPQALPYVFDRFYRADKSRARFSGGSGLGLAIVKQLVEAHGGKVTAFSPVFQNSDQSGYGTRITFTLPSVSDR